MNLFAEVVRRVLLQLKAEEILLQANLKNISRARLNRMWEIANTLEECIEEQKSDEEKTDDEDDGESSEE